MAKNGHHTHVYGNALSFSNVVYGMRYTGMQCAVFSFAVEGGVWGWWLCCFLLKKLVYTVVALDIYSYIANMAVHEDVLRIKKSLEKMMLKKSVVNWINISTALRRMSAAVEHTGLKDRVCDGVHVQRE